MKKATAISNAEIVAALLQHGTIKDAAQAVGITARALYERMGEKDFKAEYAAAKSEITRGAVNSLNDKLTQAINTVAEIMNDTKVNAAIRLQAAQTILNNAGKYESALQASEKIIEENAGALDFSFRL